jgi:hypothetical protein
MTQNASFGLVLAAATHPNPRRAVKTQIEPKTSVSTKKNSEKKIKPSFGADLVIATHDPLGEGNPTAGSCLQARRMEVVVVVNKPTPGSRLRARRVGVVVVGGW